MTIIYKSDYIFSAPLSVTAEAEQELKPEWITGCDDECDNETFTEDEELVCWGDCIQALREAEMDKD